MPAKESLTKNINVLAASGLSGKTITGVAVYMHGSVTVIEISFSGGSSFIKERQGVIEVGGTNEFGTGTVQ